VANDKKFVVKRGLATPNVDFANGGGSISATFLSTSNTLSFSGNTGQLFSITDSMSGTIFSVNDISGIPSIEVIDTGSVKIAETFGTVAVGANTLSNYKFYVSGNTLFGNSVTLNSTLIANGTVGTSGFVLTSNGTGVYWAAANSSITSVLNANNASFLNGRIWETAGAIGATVANTGAFTSLTASANVNIDSGVLFVDSTNNRVGIGNTNPSFAFQVDGDALFASENIGLRTRFISGKSSPTSAAGPLYLQFNSSNPVHVGGGTGSADFYVPNGNVAIGATAAPTKLFVNGHMSVANGFGIFANGTLGANGLVLTSNGTSLYWGSVSASGGGFTGNTVSANSTIVRNQSYNVNAAAGWVTMTLPSTVTTGDIFIVHSQTGNTRILNNSINIMDVGTGNDLVLESGETVWLQAVNATAVDILFTYPAGGTPAVVANSSFATNANNSLFANSASFVYGKQESQLSVAASNTALFLQNRTWETAGAIGATVANTGAFTTISTTGNIQQQNANYLNGRNSSGGSTRLFGINSANTLYVGAIDTQLSETLFVNNGVEQMRIQSSGNVSIGSTTTPTRLFVNGHMSLANGFGIYANGTLGANGLVLTSNGTSLFWGSIAAAANATFSTTANNALFANSASFVYGKQESQLSVANAVYAQSSNSANFANAAAWLGGFQSSYYTNATNITTGTLPEAQLPFRMNQNVRTTDNVTFANLTITGSVTVTGNVTTWSSNNLNITDNMIYLNSNSQVANPDIGIAANYNDGTYRHTGIFRDATDGVWKVFDQYLPEPDASPYIDTANASFRIADFQANVVNASSVVINNAQAYRQRDGTGTVRTLLTTLSDSSVVINGFQGTNLINAVNGATYHYGSGGGGGSIAMTILTGGNIGIGNTSPASKLHVARGNSGLVPTAVDGIYIENDGSSNGFYVLQTATTGGGKSFSITNAGNVGIGNTTPGQRLQVDGSVGIKNGLVANGSFGNAGFVLTSNGSVAYWANASSISGTVASANNANFLQERTWATPFAIGSTVANTGAFTTLTASANVNVDSGTLFTDATNNRVGVGNTNPTTSLHVQGNALIGGDGASNYDFKLQRLNGGIRAVQHDFAAAANSPWILHGENLSWTGERAGTVESTQAFRPYYEAFAPAVGYKEFGFANVTSGNFTGTNLIPNLVLTGTGRVGVGTTNPITPFVVSNAGAGGLEFDGSTGLIQSYNRGTSAYQTMLFDAATIVFRPSGTEAARITATGNVAIGSTDAPTKLFVNGHMSVANGFGIFANGVLGANGLVLTSNGTSLFWGSVSAASASTANNASFLNGRIWETAGAIGATVANTGAFTTLTASANVNLDSGTLFVDGPANRVGVGTTIPSSRFQVGAEVIDDNAYAYDGNTAIVVHQQPTSTTVLNDPRETLLLARQGTSGQAFGAAASFDLSRYENNSTNSRTRLDVKLAHGNFLSAPTIGMTLLSSGNVGLGGNTTPGQTLQVDGSVGIKNGLVANGSLGSAGLVLTSNGSVAYWANASAISGTAATANNASFLNGRIWETAGAIGATVANTGAFTRASTTNGLADNTGTGGILRLNSPGGASYGNNTPVVNGAIKIKLPVAANNSGTMMRMTVKFYDYNGSASGTSRTIDLGGYNYTDGNWYNYFATQTTMGGSDVNVRFGYDGTGNCIWIGDTNSTWSYPQIFVTDFQGGFGNFTHAIWGSGWTISAVTAFDTVVAGPIIAAKQLTSQNFNSYALGISGTAANAALLNSQNAAFYTDIPARLGFTPVQQGGGTGQSTNKLYIGWSNTLNGSASLRLTVDSTDFGNTWPINISGTVSGTVATANNASFLNGRIWETAGAIGSTVANTGAFTTLNVRPNQTGAIAAVQVSNNSVGMYIVPNAGGGAYNNLVSAGDNLIYFSNNTINGGNLVIGAWSDRASGYGIRFSNAFNIAVASNTFTMNANTTINGNTFFNRAIFANGAIGANGLVLTSNGNGVFWGSVGTTTNAVTFNNSGSGAASGTTFDGSAARTISYNTVGAPSTTGTGASGTWGISISGISTATSGQLQGHDIRTISPSSITTNRAQFGFTSFNNNNTSPYADFFHLRSYTDASGGNDNLVMFRKDAIGMRIYQQTYGSATAYSSFKDIAFTDGTNASGTWGINVTGSSASVVQTVTGTTSAELVRGNMGDNDQARILVGATATNAGFLEIATADDGTEPIHVRQYTGVFSTIARTATLLDGSGNTSFPGAMSLAAQLTVTGARPLTYASSAGSLTIQGDSGGWATGTYFLGSGGANLGGFGGYGGGNALTYLWAGTDYASPAIEIYTTGQYAQSPGSFRAPIFYDSNNTAYYMNPLGTTNLLGNLYVARDGTSNDTFGGLEVREYSYAGAATGAANEAPGINFHWGSRNAARIYMNGSGHFVFAGQSDITNNRRDIIFASGYAATRVDAPIFRDSDNTAFYFDGASTTNINTMSGNGKTMFETADTYLRINQGSSFSNGTWFGGVLVRADGVYAGSNGGTTNSRVYMSSGTYNGTNVIALDGSNGRITALDIRSAIFYDTDNTGFYVNPAGDSVLNRTNTYLAGKDVNTNWNTGFSNTPTQSYNFHGDVSSGGPAGTWWFYESMRHSNASALWGTQIAWGWEDNANRLQQRNISNGTYSGWVEYLNTSDRTYSGNLYMTGSIRSTASDMRAPIFYDQDNTSYYGNFAGTSYINALNIGPTAGGSSYLNINGNNGYGGTNYHGFLTVNNTGASSNPQQYWRLNPSGGFEIVNNAYSSVLFTFTQGGDFTAAGNVTAYSDRKLKDNFEPISDAVNKVLKLNGVTFTRIDKDDTTQRYAGLIAQDVEPVLPEAVQKNDTMSYGEVLSVDYNGTIALLVEAIKEQQAHINRLEQQINSKRG
jgi:hypothetical protein